MKTKFLISLILFFNASHLFATNSLNATYNSDSVRINQFLCYYENYSRLSESDQKKYKLLYDIWETDKYKVDKEILYPYGARYPVRAAETPKGLTSDMKMYVR